MQSERNDYISFIKSQEGVPYLWAHKGLELAMAEIKRAFKAGTQMPVARGFDCSGLVTCGIWAATQGDIDWRANFNCNKLFAALDDVAPDSPKAGDLAFYGFGRNMLTHVMTLDTDLVRVYGACGGGSHCTTPEEAAKLDAKVRYRSNSKYRKDFIAFKRLPF